MLGHPCGRVPGIWNIMAAEEIALPGGRTTSGVVRVGDTVRRPLKSNSPFVHQLLKHLEAQGFAGAPRFLGIDSANREILSFIPGFVPDNLGEFLSKQLSSAARLLRAMHDATTNCDFRGGSEVICHGDASPCNCVFVDGVPTAFIDCGCAPRRRGICRLVVARYWEPRDGRCVPRAAIDGVLRFLRRDGYSRCRSGSHRRSSSACVARWYFNCHTDVGGKMPRMDGAK
jgi:hypothetical protein